MAYEQDVLDELEKSLNTNTVNDGFTTEADVTKITVNEPITSKTDIPPAKKSKVGPVLILIGAVVLFLYFKKSK